MKNDELADRVLCNFELKIGDVTLEASARIPTKPIRVVDLLPVLQSFDDAVVGVAVKGVDDQGKKVSCCAGCGACCRQLVPISETEARYLTELVADLAADLQAKVRERFEKTLMALDQQGMLLRLRKAGELKDSAEREQLGLDYFKLGIPCPFLEEESCSIYPHRPMSCREYLVTSPAINCANPQPDSVERVALPVQFSRILSRFGDGMGKEQVRWVPLVLALEWTQQQHQNLPQTFPGPELFKNFLSQITGSDIPPASS